LVIDTCAEGVAILDTRDLESDKKRANDAAYNLARNLLAAQLNVDAGAAHSADVDEAIAEANALLTAIGFDGTGEFLDPKSKGAEATLRQQALAIAAYLDAYNNNLALPPYPGYYP
jgi:ABC-type sugar transport system substrate-binding protein